MIEVYRGEKRYLSCQLSAVLAEGDSLTGTPTVEVVVKRGRAPTTLAVSTPSAPAISGTEVRFWVDVPEDTERANYLAVVECGTANGEVAREEVPILVE